MNAKERAHKNVGWIYHDQWTVLTEMAKNDRHLKFMAQVTALARAMFQTLR